MKLIKVEYLEESSEAIFFDVMYWEDLARDEYYKLYNSGMFWEFFPNLSGDYLQDKTTFLNFIAERENKKEYFTLINSK